MARFSSNVYMRRWAVIAALFLMCGTLFFLLHNSSVVSAQDGGSDPGAHNEAAISVQTVSFTGSGLDGSTLYDWWDDSSNWNNEPDSGESTTDTQIIAPEWVKATGKNKFALEGINTQWHVAATFSISLFSGSPTPVAWATANNSNLNLANASVPVTLTYNSSSGVWSGVFQITSPSATVDYFDVTWTWHVQIGAHIYTDTSSHSIGVGSPGESYSDSSREAGGARTSEVAIAIPLSGDRDTVRNLELNPIAGLLLGGDTALLADSNEGDSGEDAAKAYANVVKAVTAATAGKNLNPSVAADRDKICTIVLNNLNAFGGKYEFPNVNKAMGRLDAWSAHALLQWQTGSCGNWEDLMHDTLQKTYGINAQIATPETFDTEPNPAWSDNAECFKTNPVNPQGGGAATQFVFGDHAFLAFQGIVYDPSFTLQFTGTWDQYMHDKVISQNALPDATKVAVWTQCDAINNPGNVVWKSFNLMGAVNVLNLDETTSGATKTWLLDN